MFFNVMMSMPGFTYRSYGAPKYRAYPDATDISLLWSFDMRKYNLRNRWRSEMKINFASYAVFLTADDAENICSQYLGRLTQILSCTNTKCLKPISR